MDERNERDGSGSPGDIWVPLRRRDLSAETLRHLELMLERVPDLPVSVQRIIGMVSDPDCDSRAIAEVASADPVLVSQILMMVNSSYYGLSRKIDNLRLAIVLLGLNEVRNIAVRCGFSRVMDQFGGSIPDTRSLWAHSCLVSLCAEALVGEEDPQRAGVVLTMGMLHDIGKFALYTIGVLMQRKGIRPPGASDIPRDISLLEKEERLFGANHAVIGGLLAERWNLSVRIRSVLECHHHPSFFGVSEIPSEYVEDVAAVCIADLMANRASHPEEPVKAPHRLYYDLLGLDPEQDREIPPGVAEKFEQVRTLIG